MEKTLVNIASYNRNLWEIKERRGSTTQGMLDVYYDGALIQSFGDDIILVGKEWESKYRSDKDLRTQIIKESEKVLIFKLNKMIDNILGI